MLSLARWCRTRSNEATPLSSQATASPSMMQERERRRPNVSTISGKRRVKSLPVRHIACVRRLELLHVAAELIGWENSDAQNHLVCRCPRFDRDWPPSIGQGIEPLQLMVNAKDLSRAEFVGYTFVFH